MGIIAQKAVTAANQKAVNGSNASIVQIQGDDHSIGQRSAVVSIKPATSGSTGNEVTCRRYNDAGTVVEDELVIDASKELRVPFVSMWEFECTTFASNFLLTVRQ